MACFDLSLYSRIEEACRLQCKNKGYFNDINYNIIMFSCKKTKTEHYNVIYEIMFAILLTRQVAFCYD